MSKKYHREQELVDEYSKFGDVYIKGGVLEIQPFVEVRAEATVLDHRYADMDLDDIPPHAKATSLIYFYNRDSIFIEPSMHCLTSPTTMEVFNGRRWVKTIFLEEWEVYAEQVEDMPNIDFPVVVLPMEAKSRRIALVTEDHINLFSSVTVTKNKILYLEEFTRLYAHIFDPDQSPDGKIQWSKWIEVVGSPGAVVDVVEETSEGVRLVFTVPPLCNYHEERNVIRKDFDFSIPTIVMQAGDQELYMKGSGDDFLKPYLDNAVKGYFDPDLSDECLAMWKIIADHYGFRLFTDLPDHLKDINEVEEPTRAAGESTGEEYFSI